MRIRQIKRNIAAVRLRGSAPAGGGDVRWPTVSVGGQERALQAHRIEGIIATITATRATYIADRTSFRLRARTTGTNPVDVTDSNPWCRAFNVSPGGDHTATSLRKWLSLGLDYYGEAWLYQSSTAITPVIGAVVEAIQAPDGYRDPDGTPRILSGYVMRTVGGKEIARFDANGVETHTLPYGGQAVVPVTGRNPGRIVRVHEIDPASPIGADIRVLRAGLPIDVLHRTRLYTKQVLENSAGKREVAYVSQGDGETRLDDTMLAVTEQRLQAHARAAKGGLLTVPAEIKIVEVGGTAIAAEVDGVAATALRDILDVWLMPPSLLGRAGDRTYENQSTELLQWTRSHILDVLETISSAINRTTMRFDGIEVYWDTTGSQVLAEAYAESTERGAALWDRDAITLNEFRRMSGLEPVEGPEGEMRKSELAPTPVVPPFPEAPPAQDPPPTSPDAPAPVVPKTTQRSADSDRRFDALAIGLDVATEQASAELAGYVQRQHARIARMAVGALRRRAGVERDDDPTPIPDGVGADDLIDAAARTAEVTDDLPALYNAIADVMAAAHVTATEAAGLLEMAKRMRAPEGAHLRYAQVIAAQRERLINGEGAYNGWVGTIRDDIESALVTSRARGESVDQLAARIYALVDADPTVPADRVGLRAEMIARTETTSLSNALAETQWAETGLVQRKRWYSIGDNRTRASHRAVNGTEIPWEDDFTVGGHRAKRPHDPRLPASEAIGCRCRLIPITDPALVTTQGIEAPG